MYKTLFAVAFLLASIPGWAAPAGEITHLSGISRVQNARAGTGSVRVAKAAMRVLGLPGWTMRAPYLSLDEQAHRDVAEYLQSMKIPELEPLLARA